MKKIMKKLKLKNGAGVYPAPKNGAGFTLIELIVALAVLAILAGSFVIVIDPLAQIKKSRDNQRKSDLAQLQRALETYYNDFGRYPLSSNSPNYQIMSLTVCGGPCSWGEPFGVYMDNLPKDPISGQTYRYVADSSRQFYRIYGSLERKEQDPQVCNVGTNDPCNNLPAGVVCGSSGEVCNFGVSSANVSP